MNENFTLASLEKQRKARDRVLKSKAFHEYSNSIHRACAIATHHSVWKCSDHIKSKIDEGWTDLDGIAIKRAWLESLKGEEPRLVVDAHNSTGDELLGLYIELRVIAELDSQTPEDAECELCYDDDGPTLSIY